MQRINKQYKKWKQFPARHKILHTTHPLSPLAQFGIMESCLKRQLLEAVWFWGLLLYPKLSLWSIGLIAQWAMPINTYLQCSSQQPIVSQGQFGIRYLKPSGSKSGTEISGSSQTIGEFGIPQMLFVTLPLRSLGNHMLFVILSLRSLGNHITI